MAKDPKPLLCVVHWWHQDREGTGAGIHCIKCLYTRERLLHSNGEAPYIIQFQKPTLFLLRKVTAFQAKITAILECCPGNQRLGFRLSLGLRVPRSSVQGLSESAISILERCQFSLLYTDHNGIMQLMHFLTGQLALSSWDFSRSVEFQGVLQISSYNIGSGQSTIEDGEELLVRGWTRTSHILLENSTSFLWSPTKHSET